MRVFVFRNDEKEEVNGTGFYAKVNVEDSDVYGVFTNNHVIPSEEMAREAEVTFGFDVAEKGATIRLRPDKIFRTNKVRFFNIFSLYVFNHVFNNVYVA